MNRLRNSTIASRRAAPWLAAAMLAIAPTVFAHAGFNHVMGTVTKISGNVMTVKTTKGEVEVKLGDRTDLTRNDRKAQLADLKPGARVVAEVPEGSKDNIAQSVKIGVITKTATARPTHTSQK